MELELSGLLHDNIEKIPSALGAHSLVSSPLGDGEAIADGPPRGTVQRWFSAVVDLPLEPGEHVLTARLFAFGPALTARGQMSIAPGLFVQDESGLLSPDWDYQVCMGCSFSSSKTDWGSYAHLLTDEAFNWNALEGKDTMYR